MIALLLLAAAIGFLLGAAIGLNLYLLPRPRCFGFEVSHDG